MAAVEATVILRVRERAAHVLLDALAEYATVAALNGERFTARVADDLREDVRVQLPGDWR